VARFRRPVLVACVLAGLYVVGYGVAAQGGIWGLLLPDLSRHDLTASLWGTPGTGLSIWQAIHACAWCAVGIALDSGILTRRVVA